MKEGNTIAPYTFRRVSNVYMLRFNFILVSNILFFCFWVLVMYDNNMIMSLKQKKRTKDKTEPQHNTPVNTNLLDALLV